MVRYCKKNDESKKTVIVLINNLNKIICVDAG